jgi:hypothetical protein
LIGWLFVCWGTGSINKWLAASSTIPHFQLNFINSICVPIARFVLQESMDLSNQLKLIGKTILKELESPFVRLSGDSGKLAWKRYFMKK